MQTQPQEPRRFWPWIAVVAVTLLALIVPAVWLPGTSEPRATARATEYHSALLGLRQELAATQQALLVLTEPSSKPNAFDEVAPSLSRLDQWGQLAEETAAKSLPRAWPLASSEPFKPLGQARDMLAHAAEAVRSIVSDLAEVLNYRAGFDEILAVGALPLTPPRNFSRFKGRLADLLATQTTALTELPRSALLRGHDSQVRDAVGRLEDWVDEYTNALWIGDTPSAAALLNELRSTRDGLEVRLYAELSDIRVGVDTRILVLADELEGALADLEAAVAGYAAAPIGR